MRLLLAALGLLALTGVSQAQTPLEPFVPDEHTRLLYHFDEGQGELARDAGGNGQDGVLQGAKWQEGRYGGGVWLDGRDDAVFLRDPTALEGLKQITVECWFSQDDTWGRRFLIGDDVCFHFEVDDSILLSISLYNFGGSVNNAEGKPHQQVWLNGVTVRPGRWHHMAITYDGEIVSYFLDGVLRGRKEGPRDFTLGVPARGLWVGSYVGMDYWYSGLIDEVRVSDVVRYDPERKLDPGEAIFGMPASTRPLSRETVIRTPRKTGEASLDLTVKRLYGGDASAWVYLKAPGEPAQIVGEVSLPEAGEAQTSLALEVSDEVPGEGGGTYVVGLVPRTGGYFAVTAASLNRGGAPLASWQGEARSRRTFGPPVLVPLQVGKGDEATAPRVLLEPAAVDRAWGGLQIDIPEPGQTPLMSGEGYAEWWVTVPREATYRVHLRYCSGGRPCDIVVDGKDVHPYNMCALNSPGRARAQDALWEYQGTVTLEPGAHWVRIQDVPPDIVALRLEQVKEPRPVAEAPWGRSAVPTAQELEGPATWAATCEFGKASGRATADDSGLTPGTRFAARFDNTDPTDLYAGDRVRFSRRVRWDLEPFGRLSFTVQGQESGCSLALWAVDAKGDEKLLWRQRDTSAEETEAEALLNFEGISVFDPSRVVALVMELDEGNVKPTEAHEVTVTLRGLAAQRRDALAEDEGYRERLGEALAGATAALREAGTRARALLSPGFRPWAKPVVPETHPLYDQTEPRPVKRETFGYDLHSTGPRDISPGCLDDYRTYYNFGDVCWPHAGICPQRRNYKTDEEYQAALVDMERRLEAVRDRGLYLFDIWGYVPYGEAGEPLVIAPEHDVILKRVFGERFTGYDNGEQDGRYIGSYADRGNFTDRRGGWEDFVRWDEHVCSENMGYMNATGSLNFSHYYGERGDRTLGLETAQGLPSDTLMFAFLRGASKQYGRLTSQATSIWSRFGYNMYHDRHTEGGNGYGLGPNKGCSLSLHKRLFFQSYSGGDTIVGTEAAQFTGDRLESGAPELSPLGRDHLEVMDWVKRHPDRGVLYTPVAFMLDFCNGWNMPRHLYRGDKYKVWGKLPYEKGDYLTDAMFRLTWPGYEDTSYLRNERGFVTPTPYGDIFDVITNRCHPSILGQYTTIMLLGDVEITPEVAANLEAFVRAGGDLLTDALNARKLPATLTGVALSEATGNAVTTASVAGGDRWAEEPYTYTEATPAGASALLVNETGAPVLTVNEAGEGRVVVCTADFWMTDKLTYADPKLVNMEPPYRLLAGVQAVLGDYFGSFSPVIAEPAGLNVRVNCYDGDPSRLLVTLTNNDLFANWEGTLRLREGWLQAARDWRADADLTAGERVRVSVPAGDVAVVELRR